MKKSKRNMIFGVGIIWVVFNVFSLMNCSSKDGGEDTQEIVDGSEETENTPETGGAGEENNTDDDGHCSNIAIPQLTHGITDLSKVKVIVPSGNLGAGAEIVGRTYFHIKDEIREKEELVPVYAPANATLLSLSYYIPQSAPPDYPPDYALTFQYSCEVNFGFAHLKELIPEIQKVAPSTPSSSSAQQQVFETIMVSAGDLIGYFKKSPTAFDFIVEIRTTPAPNSYVNQERYENDNNGNALYQVCPYQYLTESLRNTYYSFFGTPGGENVSGITECRSTSRDIMGTISGTWFLDRYIDDGTDTTNDGDYRYRLDIASTLTGEVRIGGLGSGQIIIATNNPTYQNPETMTGTHCYEIYQGYDFENPSNYIYLKNVSGTQLEVQYGIGSCPGISPTENTIMYYR